MSCLVHFLMWQFYISTIPTCVIRRIRIGIHIYLFSIVLSFIVVRNECYLQFIYNTSRSNRTPLYFIRPMSTRWWRVSTRSSWINNAINCTIEASISLYDNDIWLPIPLPLLLRLYSHIYNSAKCRSGARQRSWIRHGLGCWCNKSKRA